VEALPTSEAEAFPRSRTAPGFLVPVHGSAGKRRTAGGDGR